MPEYSEPAAPDVLEQQDTAQDPSGYDEAYNQYQNALRQTFEDTRHGKLIEAGRSLLDLSEWLLGHAVELGELLFNIVLVFLLKVQQVLYGMSRSFTANV